MSKRKIRKRKPVCQPIPGMTASQADRHRLYELSVQHSESTIELIESIFASKNDRSPLSIREDFCGTSLLCADWVKSDPGRTALGVDNDRTTLDWGIEHNISPLRTDAKRVELLQQDVRDETKSGFDTVAALNFSFSVCHKRADLIAYFKSARAALADDGFLLLDLHGGPDSQFQLEESKELNGFDYVWEQEMFDPINNRTVCHIHFRFHDGTRMNNAFTYDWRLWSIPELKEAMKEAGFESVEVWWDGEDDTLSPVNSAENTEAWIAYMAAWK